MQQTLIALMQDKPGVLHRAVSLLRRRGFNIASLVVGASETPGVSRMTVVVEADDATQVARQLERLIEVIAVRDLTHRHTVQRETVLVKLAVSAADVPAVATIARRVRARIVDRAAGDLILELTDAPVNVTAFLRHLESFTIVEVARTGRLAMARGGSPAAAGGTPGAGSSPNAATPFRCQADGAADDEAA